MYTQSPRPIILALIAARRQSMPWLNLKWLSQQLGRNDAYLQQYLYRGSPKILPETIRHHLAELLGTDEQILREDTFRTAHDSSPVIAIPFYDDSQNIDRVIQHFDRYELQALFPDTDLAQLRMVQIQDSSMAPYYAEGTAILIDRADQDISKPGIFALAFHDFHVIRSLSMLSGEDRRDGAQQARIAAFDTRIAPMRTKVSELNIIGRAIWQAGPVTDHHVAS